MVESRKELMTLLGVIRNVLTSEKGRNQNLKWCLFKMLLQLCYDLDKILMSPKALCVETQSPL